MAASRTPDEPRTADRILDVAERLVQTRGFNRFSYADIAAELWDHDGQPALPLPQQGSARPIANHPKKGGAAFAGSSHATEVALSA